MIRPRLSNPDWLVWVRPGLSADFFLRPPTLRASNFAALWSTDPIFSALKDLNLLKKFNKNQKASSILRVGFAHSKWSHLHGAYLVTVCNRSFIAVCAETHYEIPLLLLFDRKRKRGKYTKLRKSKFLMDMLWIHHSMMLPFWQFMTNSTLAKTYRAWNLQTTWKCQRVRVKSNKNTTKPRLEVDHWNRSIPK